MEVQGAEANVDIREDRVVKSREPKEYRHPVIDEKIREKRTSEELKNIKRARKYGVNTPETEKTGDFTLEQDKVDGKTLKQVIENQPSLMKNLGHNVAKMHSADVIHGDLTTSNALYSRENGVFLIDFGLSQVSERTEDKAVDLHLLKQVLRSSHPEVSEKCWKEFQEGYDNFKESQKIVDQLEEVESRGRYK